MKKSTILFGISIVNMVLFLIGMIILFAAAASGSADGNNFALILSIISGVIFEIINIVQTVKIEVNGTKRGIIGETEDRKLCERAESG